MMPGACCPARARRERAAFISYFKGEYRLHAVDAAIR